MMQSPILVIAVVLFWLAITGEADEVECLVKYQNDDGTNLADLTLTSSSDICDKLASPEVLYKSMTSPKQDFHFIHLQYFPQQRPDRVVTDNVVTDNVRQIREFVYQWIGVAWQHAPSYTSNTVLFKAPAEESLRDMCNTFMTCLEIGKSPVRSVRTTLLSKSVDKTSVSRMTEGRSHVRLDPLTAFVREKYSLFKKNSYGQYGHALRLYFPSQLFVMAVFNFEKSFDIASEVWTEASKTFPAALFVKLGFNGRNMEIGTDNWMYVKKAIKDLGSILRFGEIEGLPIFSAYVPFLATAQKNVEEAGKKNGWIHADDELTSGTNKLKRIASRPSRKF